MPKKKQKKTKKIKDLHLDKPTSHGGWPGGHRGSWNNKTPVNIQIVDWLKSMGMLEDVKHGVLSENKLRDFIKKMLLNLHNYKR
jgi:hypothetical protein